MKKILIISVLVFTTSVFAMDYDAEKEAKHDEEQSKMVNKMQAKIEAERQKFLQQYYGEDTNKSK